MKKQDEKPIKKNSWELFWPELRTKEEAEKVINYNFWFFVCIAILLSIMYILVFGNYFAIVESLLLLFLALMVRFTKSRFFAVALFILVSLEVIVTILAKLGITEGGTNIFLAALFFLASLNTLRATFKYKTYTKLN